MKVRELAVLDAWEFTPAQHRDDRGVILEWFRNDAVTAAAGHPLNLVQANHSTSRRGTVRGMHFAEVPPGQAKYVYCPQGAVLDVVLDIRVGSPTFGVCDVVRLDDIDRRAVYISEGLAHGFVALDDGSSLTYLCSQGYNPSREHGVNPLDPALDLPWPQDLAPLLSPKDSAAPTLAEARERGLLPDYETCRAFYDELDRPRHSGQ